MTLPMPDVMYYLAGPMTGYEDFNYPAFEAAAAALRDAGLKILSPHEVPWPEGHVEMTQETLWSIMMEETGKLLGQCGGIILLKGWPQSRGAREELKLALGNEWPVYFYHEFNLYSMNNDEKVMAQ